MAQRVCLECLKNDSRCDDCNTIIKFYSIEEFCIWSINQPYTIEIAHNLKGYDGIFIFNWIVNNLLPHDFMPTVLCNGIKIQKIKFRTITYLDSHSFIPMQLADFADTWGINEFKKGFFPHSFNLPENQNKILDSYPDAKYYEPQFFNQSKLDEFNEWYSQVKNQVFDFKKEFEEYCWSDVQLLTEGCLKFRKFNIETDKVDPFRTATTMPSFCNYIYRNNYMPYNSIGIIPENGYNANHKTSIKSQQFLTFWSEYNGLEIKHANNGG